ncbi:small subunit ribosomal protein S20 [Breznakia sp. PF5-3]|uniref:30S ribosomal protein S20 n=1 Tax=unclassified Breznakia TaxID=2623764 RepID=UPI00240720FA|nr:MULTISPECIES: 30S ribosomal protein S20 [unclassified Breznakia]MDL2276110.1 30S ribosomal protein S20 [Breznakia sp. OttesenSCG-928-G09]MDF9823866.1 small subunit ribosomal protein S20 [Breznakia sp. PM6-1]MDF9834665.1 small subunit ribosomal protein S20 [Breznakia sp. PF5-3]MDF9836900.1 small subunit ribosomal protein S20 [Breznakia sp. PFB2-8]MDF9858917.1 small subunit ribosomal protein S20 [Breznakia sp. PH5-24]
MPNIKSQKKRVITNDKRHLANASQKTQLRSAIKAVKVAVEANDKAAATEAYALASKNLDKAVSSKIYHKNYASRQKSRLAKAINAIG